MSATTDERLQHLEDGEEDLYLRVKRLRDEVAECQDLLGQLNARFAPAPAGECSCSFAGMANHDDLLRWISARTPADVVGLMDGAVCFYEEHEDYDQGLVHPHRWEAFALAHRDTLPDVALTEEALIRAMAAYARHTGDSEPQVALTAEREGWTHGKRRTS